MPKKIKIEWFPFYQEKYLRDTKLLNLEEHGFYLLLLFFLYSNGGEIPEFNKNRRRIAKVLGINSRSFKRLFAKVEHYFTINNGKLTHSEVTKYYSKCIELIDKKRKAANTRWHADALHVDDADALHVDDAGAYAGGYDSSSNSSNRESNSNPSITDNYIFHREQVGETPLPENQEENKKKGNGEMQKSKNSGKQKFKKPTIPEIREYIQAIQATTVNPIRFFNYYESCGWVVGKGKPMKDWRAAVRNWESRGKEH